MERLSRLRSTVRRQVAQTYGVYNLEAARKAMWGRARCAGGLKWRNVPGTTMGVVEVIAVQMQAVSCRPMKKMMGRDHSFFYVYVCVACVLVVDSWRHTIQVVLFAHKRIQVAVCTHKRIRVALFA